MFFDWVEKMGQTGQLRWLADLKLWAIVGLSWLIFLVLWYYAMKSTTYRVTRYYLVVSIWGIPLRFVRLRNIRAINSKKSFWAERWYNVIFPAHDRYLVLHKHSGLLFKKIIITPLNRFVLKEQIRKARSELTGQNLKTWADSIEPDVLHEPPKPVDPKARRI